MRYSKAKMVTVAIISVIAFGFSIYFGIDYSKKLSVSTEPKKEVEKEYSVSRVGLYKVVGLKVKNKEVLGMELEYLAEVLEAKKKDYEKKGRSRGIYSCTFISRL